MIWIKASDNRSKHALELLAGLVRVAMLAMPDESWLALDTDDTAAQRAMGRTHRGDAVRARGPIMLICVLIFLPIVLACTAFAPRVVRGRMRLADVERGHSRY